MVLNFQEKKSQQNFVCLCVRPKYVFFNSKWYCTTENAFHSRSNGAIISSPMYHLSEKRQFCIFDCQMNFFLKNIKGQHPEICSGIAEEKRPCERSLADKHTVEIISEIRWRSSAFVKVFFLGTRELVPHWASSCSSA